MLTSPAPDPAAEPSPPGFGETRGVSDTYATSRPLHIWCRLLRKQVSSHDAQTAQDLIRALTSLAMLKR